MPFVTTEPQNGEIVDADLLRNQFNALNDKIDAITPPPVPAGPTATGFGDATYNGVYIQTGTFLGKPLYTNPAGRVLFWTDLDNVWQLDTHAHDGRAGDTGQYFALPADAAPQDATWQTSGGVAPGGTFQMPVTPVTGTYPVQNDGTTPGQLASLTITNGLITGVTVVS